MQISKPKFFLLLLLLSFFAGQSQYTALSIPEAYYGMTVNNEKNFNLKIKDTFKQYKTGQVTVTGAFNVVGAPKNTFWGPTMFINKGDLIRMNITNSLNESSTVHWHGMHTPAIMDGGPHQVIAAGAFWSPYWTVKNQAATLWYHPHLHTTTQAQLTKGVGGFIIVRDAAEAALAIPRTYGVDDIPLAITSRRFLSDNSMATQLKDNYGDYFIINGTLATDATGTLKAQVTLPKQWVRFRILNAEIQRGLNLGFSDNRTFYVIGNDGGLLGAPIAVTRMAVQTGERYEIMVNLSGDVVGAETLTLKAYNTVAEVTALTTGSVAQTTTSPFGWPGSENNASPSPSTTNGPLNGGYLNSKTIDILSIKIGATTTVSTPITALPATLISNTYWTNSDVTTTSTRTINVTGGNAGTAFSLNNAFYTDGMTSDIVNLNAVEKWTIVNNNIFGHTFHLHDVSFKIISRSGGNMGTTLRSYEQGWKDSVWLPSSGSVTFIAKFDDYADSTWPYMYHCHALTHEDEGMMGQFKVTTTLATAENIPAVSFKLFPNPASDKLFINLADTDNEIYYITITTLQGRVAIMLPKPEWQNGIDISSLAAGAYILKLTDEKTKSVTTRKFIKN